MTPARSAEEWVRVLGLIPHPEGGYYRETYRARETMQAAHLPQRYGGARPFATSILFLLPSGEVSSLHKLKSDEVWHFHHGTPLCIHMLDDRGVHSEILLGLDPSRGQQLQAVVPAGRWFGAEVIEPESYALVGCTVAPGFDFADFELGRRGELLHLFPHQEPLVARLTR